MLNRWWTGVALGCAAMTATLTASAQDDTAPRATISFTAADDEAVSADADALELSQITSDLNELVAFYDAERAPGKYWIGVSCESPADSLRSQLGLEENVGLLVSEVMDDSPAKAAGIQPHDVLIAVLRKSDGEAEERKLTEIGDLSAVVQKAETKPLQLMLFRKGKQQTVELAPVERPKPEEARFEAKFINVDVPHPHNPEKVQSLLNQLQEELGGGPRALRLQMASPVVVAAPPQMARTSVFAFAGSGLPEGMTLTITKSGSNPARIEVKKGEGQVWGANENEIDTLPPEAQGLARSAIAGMSQPNFTIAVSPVMPSGGFAGASGFGSGGFGATGWSTARIPPGVMEVPAPAAQGELARQWLHSVNVPSGDRQRQAEMANLHRQLAEMLTQKGDKHPEAQEIKAKIEALQQELAAKTKATAAQNAYRSTIAKRTIEPKPVIRPPQPAPVQQQQIERLQKQIQELTHMQAKQAEAQQQQMRELQRALEKITTKP